MPISTAYFDPALGTIFGAAPNNRKLWYTSETFRGISSSEARGFSIEMWVPWADNDPYFFMQEMLGSSKINPANGLLERKKPHFLPIVAEDGIGGPNAKYYCTDCNLLGIYGNGMTGLRKSVEWKKPQPESLWNNFSRPAIARYLLTYTATLYKVLDDSDVTANSATPARKNEYERFTIIRRRFSSENEPINSKGYVIRLIGGGGPWQQLPNQTTFRRSSTSRIEMKILNVPRSPSRTLLSAASGKSNSITMLGYAPGKLIFHSQEEEPITNVFGNPAVNMNYLFLAREDSRTWNQVRIPDGLAEIRELLGGNLVAPVLGQPPFALNDFSGLFWWG